MTVNCDDFYKDADGQWWKKANPLPKPVAPGDVPAECRGPTTTALDLVRASKPPAWVKRIALATAKMSAGKKTIASKKTTRKPVGKAVKKRRAS